MRRGGLPIDGRGSEVLPRLCSPSNGGKGRGEGGAAVGWMSEVAQGKGVELVGWDRLAERLQSRSLSVRLVLPPNYPR